MLVLYEILCTNLLYIFVKILIYSNPRYNSLNQLVCILCNNIIKNDLLWVSHLQSKQHKEVNIVIYLVIYLFSKG